MGILVINQSFGQINKPEDKRSKRNVDHTCQMFLVIYLFFY